MTMKRASGPICVNPPPVPGSAIVAWASMILPPEARPDWTAEWIGELHHYWKDAGRRNQSAPLARLLLMVRCLGAFSDAVMLRRRLGGPLMLANDLRYAIRTLVRRPGFSAVVVITLALGIGATTAIFSVVNAVLLRELPYAEPERLVNVRGVPTNGDASKVAAGSSWPDFLDLRSSAQSYSALAAADESERTLTGSGLEPSPVASAAVTPSFFATLGVAPAAGRGLTEGDATRASSRVVLVSEALWRTRFGGDRTRLGETLTLDGVPHTIIGVMPAGFDFPEGTSLWTAYIPQAEDLERGVHRLRVIGRLGEGIAREAAEREARSIFARLEAEHPATNALRSVVVEPLGASAVRGIRPTLLVMFGAVVLVLLIVCTNVASLFLARAASREREVALRIALGARRARIARQMLVESVLLSFVGGALGLAIALWGVEALVALAPGSIPRVNEIGVDRHVLAFALGLSMLTGLVFGAAPAIQLGRVNASGPLREGAPTLSGSRSAQRVRKALVVMEVALAMVLVIGAALLLESLARLQRVDPGFDPERVVVARLKLPVARYADSPRVLAYYERVRARVAAVPGVASVALAYEHPLSAGWTTSFTIVGRPQPPEGQEPEARMRPVSPGYFATAGVRLVRGRDITDHDRGDAPGVVIINQAFARTHFPDENPVGRRIERGPWFGGTYEIVGVIADERFLGLSLDADPATYFPHAQIPLNDMHVVMKTRGDPLPLVSLLRAEMRAVDPDIPIEDVRTMDDLVGGSLARPRFIGMLLGLFAAAALLLAAVGIYGVLSYTVAERTPEIGIRMALGARRAQVLRAVVGQGMALASIGIAVGGVVAALSTRVLGGLLFGVEPLDVTVFAGVAGILVTVAALAAWIPARSASLVDPMGAMRRR